MNYFFAQIWVYYRCATTSQHSWSAETHKKPKCGSFEEMTDLHKHEFTTCVLRLTSIPEVLKHIKKKKSS